MTTETVTDPYPTRVPTAERDFQTTLDQLKARGAMILGWEVDSKHGSQYVLWVAWPTVSQSEMKL